MTHDNITCTKYNEPVLPNEDGNCSLCGAKIFDILTEQDVKRFKELEAKAAITYVKCMGIKIANWIEEDEEKKEYCVLLNKPLTKKTCVCGTHIDWLY